MFKRTLERGFTLIELLVVIAIIGILAATVLASLGTARTSGSEAAMKSTLSSIRNQTEVLSSTFGCYTNAAGCNSTTPAAVTTCTGGMFANTQLAAQITNVTSNAGNNRVACAATVSGGAWAVAAELKSNTAQAWCVDSTGAAKQINHTGAYTDAALAADIAGGVCGS